MRRQAPVIAGSTEQQGHRQQAQQWSVHGIAGRWMAMNRSGVVSGSKPN